MSCRRCLLFPARILRSAAYSQPGAGEFRGRGGIAGVVRQPGSKTANLLTEIMFNHSPSGSILAAVLLGCGFFLSARAAPSPPSITRLVLVDALTQQDIRTLKTGDTLSLSDDGTRLNIRADVSGPVGSVWFLWDGASKSTENVKPYALAADDGGRYRSWKPPLGTHTLRAVPYSGGNRRGTAGPAKEVKLTVVRGGIAEPAMGDPDKPTPPESLPVSSVALFNSKGQLNQSLYQQLATNYDKATMEKRFGPSFLDLSPKAADDRPTLYRPASIARTSGYIRTNPYELGGPPKTDSDYWSDAGQLGYVPTSSADPGLDRIQTYAYYDRVFAISPRLDYTNKQPHPDLHTRDPDYIRLFGEGPKHPIAMVRNYGMQQNEALVLYRKGYLALAGTQTSRGDKERPLPGFKFPSHKRPTSLAVTTANEFALVTVWDTTAKKGQLAVFALEGKYIPFHTWPYMGLPNQGSWSAFKLLGYVDLPMITPTSVAAASNGWWSGPSQTGGLVLSQIKLSQDSHRKNVYNGSWKGVVATGGYAIVSSQYEGKVAIVDLSPLFAYMRESYLSSAAAYKKTIAARGAGERDFPESFSAKSSIAPKVVWQAGLDEPTAVLAGHRMDRWTRDYYKAYVACRDGTIHIVDTSSLMKRFSWERRGSLRIAGSLDVGRNPVGMCFARRGVGGLPLLPVVDGRQKKADPLNNLFYVAVRGDRKVVGVVTFEGKGAVFRTIKDKRMGDPVAVSTAVRGPMLSVADFRGKKLLSFRVGKIEDRRNNKVYGCGHDGKAPVEFAGEIRVAGHPFLLNSTNVN